MEAEEEASIFKLTLMLIHWWTLDIPKICPSFERSATIFPVSASFIIVPIGTSIYKSSPDLLVDFRYTKKFKAQNGENGSGSNKYGKSGEDLYIDVPIGSKCYCTISTIS